MSTIDIALLVGFALFAGWWTGHIWTKRAPSVIPFTGPMPVIKLPKLSFDIRCKRCGGQFTIPFSAGLTIPEVVERFKQLHGAGECPEVVTTIPDPKDSRE